MKMNCPFVFSMQFIERTVSFPSTILISIFMTLATMSIVGLNSNVLAQASARDIRGPAPVLPLASEPAAKLIVDDPLPEPLARGLVVIQYRTENLRIVPVFGPAGLNVSPRIGHLHITVDNLPWRWLDASNEPININKLPAGPHQVLIEMVDANHKVIDSKIVKFIIPELK